MTSDNVEENLHSVGTVSYTHLDVYKRQTEWRVCQEPYSDFLPNVSDKI